jgi:hypothetical protein
MDNMTAPTNANYHDLTFVAADFEHTDAAEKLFLI